MKRIAFLVLLIGISTALLSAQSRSQSRGRVTLSGTVLDKEDNSPIMQATVQLLSLPDSTMAVGDVTNNNGRFSLSVRPGKYVFCAESKTLNFIQNLYVSIFVYSRKDKKTVLIFVHFLQKNLILYIKHLHYNCFWQLIITFAK